MRILLLGSVNPLDLDIDLLVPDHLPRFGRSVPVSDLGLTLAELGHEVYIIGHLSGLTETYRFSLENGVRLIYVPGRTKEKLKALTFYGRERKLMLRQIASIKPDFIHAHWTYEYALTAQDAQVPYLITVHDDPFEVFKSFRNLYFFLRYLNAIYVRLRSDGNFVFVSNHMRNMWNRRMLACERNVIPNMTRMKNRAVQKHQETGHVISVGNLDRHKNIRGLLEAWKLVIEQNPEMKLHLVGPGLGSNDCFSRKYKDDFNSDQVMWHGSITRQELSNLYERCEVLVHPSLQESFGLIYLEAFVFNLGIIAFSKSGSVNEVVGDAGLILNSETPQSLALAIQSLLSNQNLLDELKQNGHRRLLNHYPEKIAKKYISLYEQCLRMEDGRQK